MKGTPAAFKMYHFLLNHMLTLQVIVIMVLSSCCEGNQIATAGPHML